MTGRGLRPDGTIEREGALDRVPTVFAPVVEAARDGVTRTFGARMHSAYLYGSIPRGTATPATSHCCCHGGGPGPPRPSPPTIAGS